jgi:ABC-type transport system substrate-binding protein
VLRIAHDEDVQSWDPAVAFDSASLDVLPGIFETLYQYDYLSEEYRLVPLLASDFPTYSDEGRTLRIPIRSGVHYQADRCFRLPPQKRRELTAEDFVFALKRLALPSLRSSGWWALGARIEGMPELRARLAAAPAQDRSALLESASVPGLQAEGPYVLRIRLKRAFPQIKHLLAMTFSAPIAPEAARAYSEPDGSIPHPVGTGPFELKDWQRGSRVILERNPDHHSEFYPAEGSNEYRNRGWLADAGKMLPFLDGVVFEIFRADGPAWQAFIQGKIDALRIPKDRLTGAITNQVNLTPELEAKGVRLSIESGPAFAYLLFNMRTGLLARNKWLRQAISSAIDRTKWIELVSSSAARKMTTLLPPGLRDRPESSALKYDYDLDKARALLRKAGYPGGRGLPELTLELRGTDGFNQLLGEFFVRQLAAAGIRLKFRLHGFDSYLDDVRRGNFQIAYGNWGVDYPDAQDVLQLLYGPNAAPGPNLSSFKSATANRLYERIAALEPGAERATLIAEMDGVAQEESPWVFGYYYSRYIVSQPWVLNFRNNVIILNKYKYVRVNPSLKARYLEVK